MRNDLGGKLQCAVLYAMLWRIVPRPNGCSAACNAEGLRCRPGSGHVVCSLLAPMQGAML